MPAACPTLSTGDEPAAPPANQALAALAAGLPTDQASVTVATGCTPAALASNYTPAALADLAVGALIDEAALTPKPALVDARGCGAHPDLDLALMLRSARALRPAFEQLAEASAGVPPSMALRETLGAIGRAAERTMLAATGGRNTHRGAIWIVGLLVAGAATMWSTNGKRRRGASQASRTTGGAGTAGTSDVAETTASSGNAANAANAANAGNAGTNGTNGTNGATAMVTAGEICAAAACIARFPDRHAPDLPSNGARAYQRYGAGGARAQACAGFPHVIGAGLPALRAARGRGVAEPWARLDALLRIMSTLDDTCLLHRGGRDALHGAQAGAAAVLEAGGTGTPQGRRLLDALHTALMTRNASPGGAADLLAATLFIDRLLPCEPVNQEASPWNT